MSQHVCVEADAMTSGSVNRGFQTVATSQRKLYWLYLTVLYVCLWYYVVNSSHGQLVTVCLLVYKKANRIFVVISRTVFYKSIHYAETPAVKTNACLQFAPLTVVTLPVIILCFFPFVRMRYSCCNVMIVIKVPLHASYSAMVNTGFVESLEVQELIIEMRNVNVTWRIILPVYLFTTEQRHTCIVP